MRAAVAGFLLATVFLAQTVAAQTVAAPPALPGHDWHLVKDREGIQVYTRERENGRLKAFRGTTVMHIDDWASIAAVIDDYANVPRWLYFVTSVQEIGRRTPLDRDMIFQTHLPWPLNDREAVVTGHGSTPPGTYDTVIHFYNKPDLLPPNGDYIRFQELDATVSFHWLGGNRVAVTYELEVDPAGYIPAWVANIVVQDAPWQTLKRLQATVKRPEYQGHYYDWLVTPPDYARRR